MAEQTAEEKKAQKAAATKAAALSAAIAAVEACEPPHDHLGMSAANLAKYTALHSAAMALAAAARG